MSIENKFQKMMNFLYSAKGKRASEEEIKELTKTSVIGRMQYEPGSIVFETKKGPSK